MNHVQDLSLTFLGTGTSAGVPVIGCACTVCTSDDPRDKRLRCGALVRWTDPTGQERVALIDTTPDLRQQALAHALRRCDAVLFTHNHVDHTFGLDELRRFNALMGRAIDLYAEPHTIAFLQRTFAHIFDKHQNVNDSFVANLIAHPITPARPIDLHGVRFTPIRLHHGKLPIVGFRIEPVPITPPDHDNATAFPLAYCTDVSAVPPEAWPLLRGLRTLALDALRHTRHPTHLTLDQALDVAFQVAADRTYFIHMSHELGHASTQQSLPPGVDLAHDNLTLR
jgi:phosphoribosyl 1,2-cyclic phosphate phosphodiesterase